MVAPAGILNPKFVALRKLVVGAEAVARALSLAVILPGFVQDAPLSPPVPAAINPVSAILWC